MKYRFSVIIPVYNAEKTIRRCLDSLLGQNCEQAEIILINDGSRDRSGEICKEYALMHNCIVYIEQENAGASSARNAGLQVASGEYVTFVDSDDYVLDGYFTALEPSDDDFIVFSYQTLRSDGMQDYSFSQGLLSTCTYTDVVLNVLKDRIAGPWNKRFKRAIIAENHINFKNDLIIGEDFVFGLEYMLSCGSGSVVNERLYCVDETGMDSVTRAAKYDFTQFTLIYDYAFGIAENCSWNRVNKERLLQQLDYLYCRTSFAATEHCIDAKDESCMNVRDLVQLFADQYHTEIPAVNFIHEIMRLCVKHKILPIYYIIAWLHRLLTRR